jgi:adenine-specific DNA methylase
MNRPRLLIEEWLPAAAIGVECMRERGTGQNPPNARLHVWWARRPLTVSRAAVLASLLPADFPHDTFERLLGFGHSAKDLVKIRQLMDTGQRVEGGFNCERAFKHALNEKDVAQAHAAAQRLFGKDIVVLDPMAGGGSIPLEAARLGFRTLANEYNPVACSVLEATVDYPFRFGARLAERARHWGEVWRERFSRRMARFFPKPGVLPPHCYIFARTVPCPDTGFETPLVPDWHLLKPKDSKVRVWAEPVVDKKKGTWTVRIVDNREQRHSKAEPPAPTYRGGKGISLFTGAQIPDDWIKAQAQAGKMRSALYAVAVKKPSGLAFEVPTEADLKALAAAEKELARLRPAWERQGIIPTEEYPQVSSDPRPWIYGMRRWADLFSPRQLLGMGVLVEELQRLRPEIVRAEGPELGEAVVHLLALALDKFATFNSIKSRWHPGRAVMAQVFERHDFSFRTTFAEMAPCGAGAGLAWAIDNVLEAYEELAKLAGRNGGRTVEITFGSATSLPHLADGSVTAVVVDPPYADNVQYAELADFFYVWLKRTQGHRRPEWFAGYLCDSSEEAVVNVSRFRAAVETQRRQAAAVHTLARGSEARSNAERLECAGSPALSGRTAAEARRLAQAHYQRLMTDTFRECRRVLRDDGALTVMFTHKKQEAWEALFTSLIQAGFTITATWPVKTESEHSLHQAKKNAAQSTVLLVARKRDGQAGVGYFDAAMRAEIRRAAQSAAERLMKEGLNPVDQLVGSFGPAMAVYSRYAEVRTDTGEPVGVDRALDEASEAVTEFRIRQLAERGLEGVEPEGKFYLLCWDVLQAAEFRFNEAKLLGHAVGMDVEALVAAGLVVKSGDKIRLLPAQERRRPKKLELEEVEETLFGPMTVARRRRVRKEDVLKVHPNDPRFRTALDGCHALALRYWEAGGGNPGIGSARQLALQQGWKGGSPVARLMEALVKAAPPALWHERGKNSAAAQYPEFRAWHALLEPLFGVEPPDWPEERAPQGELELDDPSDSPDTSDETEEDSESWA